MFIAGAGVAIGILLGVGGTILFRSQLYGISAVEWTVLLPVPDVHSSFFTFIGEQDRIGFRVRPIRTLEMGASERLDLGNRRQRYTVSTTPISWLAVMLRSAIMVIFFGALLFGLAGRLDIAAFWAYLLLFAVTVPVMYLAPGPELMRERIKPPPGGKDQLIRILAIPIMLAHLAIAGLDVGRFHWSDNVPVPLQVGSFIALAVCMGIWALAMHENKFFSSVIRIQRERGHRVIDTGPYRVVRHPGYAAALTIQMWSGLALGSWWSVAPAWVMALLWIRRIVIEDRTLQDELDGYKAYAQRVRYRVVPGVW